MSTQQQTQVWDVASGKPQWTVPGSAIAPAFSPDGKTLAVADDRQVKCYDAVTGEPGRTLTGSDKPIHCMAWSSDGSLLAAAGEGLQLFVWDVRSRELRDSPKLPGVGGDQSLQLGWMDDDRTLISGNGKSVSTYDTRSRKVTLTVAGRFAFAWPSANARITAMSGVNFTDIRATTDGRLLRTILSLREGQHAVISPDGHYRGSPGVEKELVYVALTDSGEQLTLTPEEFTKKYGWKNDPAKVSASCP